MSSFASQASRVWPRSGGSLSTTKIEPAAWAAMVWAVLLGATGVGGRTAYAQCPASFAAAANYNVVRDPSSVAIGDFNSDGIPDLAVAHAGINNVSILLGNASGTLQAEATYPVVGASGRSIAVGDFDGDGGLDLAVAVPESFNVSILLGNGDGTFQGAVGVGTGAAQFYSVAVADFDGDGRSDLAVTSQITDNVAILLGNGDGTFHSVVNYPVFGAARESIVIGDFNSDGRPDLAIPIFTHRVSIVLGNGDGTFPAAVEYPVGDHQPNAIVKGDFNGDGRADLAVTISTTITTNNPSVILGNGNGTFQAPLLGPTINASLALAVGDFNGDGRLDLAAPHFFDGNVSILTGNGDGTLQAEVNYPLAGFSSRCIAVDDFNGDARADLAVGAHDISVLLNTSSSPPAPTITQQPAASQTVPGGGTATLSVTADGHGSTLNYQWRKDGTPLADGGNVSGATSPTLTISPALPGDAGSYDCTVSAPGCGGTMVTISNAGILAVTSSCPLSFGEALNHAAGDHPYSVAAGDFNADGRPDLAVANSFSDTVSILLRNPDGTLQPAVNYGVGAYPSSVAVGDFNGDGRLDVVVANYDSNTISILFGAAAPSGTFQTAVHLAVGTSPFSVAAADLNADGRPDLAVANFASDNVSILIGNAAPNAGTFQAPMSYPVGHSPVSIAAEDFNGDGNPDLAVANSFGNTVSILLGNAAPNAGTFLSAVDYVVGSGPSSVAVGDFNSDDGPDLCIANYASNTFSILLGNPPPNSGTFQAATDYDVSAGPYSVAVSDFNGDGRPDVSLALPDSGRVVVRLASSIGTFQPEMAFNVGVLPFSVAAGDFDADGRADLVVANNGSDSISLLLNHGSAPAITQQPTDLQVSPGQTVTFSVIADGQGSTLTYQWQRDGTALTDSARVSGSTGSMLTISQAQSSDAGSYDCNVSSACGSTTSNSAALAVSCPADFNGSGAVSTQDIFDFLAAFFTPGSLAADFNGSGTVTTQDIFDFLGAFFTTCP